jgi:hypothetical protein
MRPCPCHPPRTGWCRCQCPGGCCPQSSACCQCERASEQPGQRQQDTRAARRVSSCHHLSPIRRGPEHARSAHTHPTHPPELLADHVQHIRNQAPNMPQELLADHVAQGHTPGATAHSYCLTISFPHSLFQLAHDQLEGAARGVAPPVEAPHALHGLLAVAGCTGEGAQGQADNAASMVR